MKEGQSPGFTDDQIGPLHNDNSDEESSVACQFQIFTLNEGPLLAVTVCYSVVGAVIPFFTQLKEESGKEAIFCHDHKIGEESSGSLK